MDDSAATILGLVLTAGGGLATAVTVLWKSFHGQVVRCLEQLDKADAREQALQVRVRSLEDNRLKDEKERSDRYDRAIRRLCEVLGDRPCLANTNVMDGGSGALERKREESDYP